MVVDPLVLAEILAIFLVAGMVKGVLGFGLPIITMSLLPFVVPVEKAIVLSAIVQPATNVFQFITSGLYRRALQLSLPLLAALVPGVVVGALFLTTLDGGMLLFLVGLTIAIFSLNELIGIGIKITEAYRVHAGFGFGFVAGVFGALTSLNGWTFIMYLVGIGASRQEFRSTIALLFLISGTLISSSFWAVGILDWPSFFIGVMAILPSFAGMWIGDRFGRKVPAGLFRKALLISLILTGVFMAARGLNSIG